LSPYVIFKAKALNKDWYNEFRKDGGGTCVVSDRGWTNDELYMEWFKIVFEPETIKSLKGEWRLLLFDGHGSYLISQVVSFCRQHKIVLLCLPSHSTYILQPCDVGAFGPLAEAYRKVLLRKTKWGAGYLIDKLMFLEILREARNTSFTEHNIKSSWEKTGLFPFEPKVVIGSLPAVILQREQEKAARRKASKPSSRPSTSGQPTPLIIETPADVNAIELIIKVSFKAVFDDLKNNVGPITFTLDQQFKNLETIIQKLGNSATAAITETVLTQDVNKELIESADYQKNRKKASNKKEDKISDARVLSVEGMDEVIRKKAAKKKEQEEKWAMEKKLKALDRSWKTLYNHTLVEFRKWGPEILQDVESIVAREERLSSPSKALKTPRARKKKVPAPLASPPITYILPQFEFDDLPKAPVKARSIVPLLPLPPPLPSPPTTPSPSKTSPSKKTIKRQAKKAKLVIQEVIQVLMTVISSGRRSIKRLFHDEVIINQGAR
jgi:hypothetical protein